MRPMKAAAVATSPELFAGTSSGSVVTETLGGDSSHPRLWREGGDAFGEPRSSVPPHLAVYTYSHHVRSENRVVGLPLPRVLARC